MLCRLETLYKMRKHSGDGGLPSFALMHVFAAGLVELYAAVSQAICTMVIT